MTMIEKAVRAADAAGDAYLATLPKRLVARPSAWRQTLARVRMEAAFLAALDAEDEASIEYVAHRLRGVDWIAKEQNARAAIGALRALATGGAMT